MSSLNNMEVDPNRARPTTASDYFYIAQPWHIYIKVSLGDIIHVMLFALFALFTLLYVGLLCISQSATRVYIGAFDLHIHTKAQL